MLSKQEIDDALELSEEWDARSTTGDRETAEEVDFDVDLRRNLLHPRLVTLTHRPSACPRCGGELHDVAIEYLTRDDRRLLVVRDVPALRCRRHGHEFLLEETLDRLERLIDLEQAEQVQPEETLHIPVFHLLKTA